MAASEAPSLDRPRNPAIEQVKKGHIVKSQSREFMEQQIRSNYQRLDVMVDHKELLEGAKTVIQALKPSWPLERIVFKQFTDGMTNKLMFCRLDGGTKDDRALVRVYGKKTEYLIDRDQELVNMVALHNVGLSPELFGRFGNGYCYGFIDGEPLEVEDMSDAHISRLVARKLAGWHRTHIPGDNTPMLFITLDRWLSLVPESFGDAEKDARYRANLSMAVIQEELAKLRDVLLGLNSPVVFCHNDLLCKNILIHHETDNVNFIDYEYGNYSYRGFDIGNHFCEFAGMEEPVDYTRYPSKEFQYEWLRQYISAWNNVPDTQVEPHEIDKLYAEVNKFALAAHFYWGSWALVQAAYSDIDFDYLNFAIVRFSEYFKRRDEFLAL
eukprot:Colp12_sorted_trinity150504_noHs@6209